MAQFALNKRGDGEESMCVWTWHHRAPSYGLEEGVSQGINIILLNCMCVDGSDVNLNKKAEQIFDWQYKRRSVIFNKTMEISLKYSWKLLLFPFMVWLKQGSRDWVAILLVISLLNSELHIDRDLSPPIVVLKTHLGWYTASHHTVLRG